MRTMSMRILIRSHLTVALPLMAMMILASDGQPNGQSAYADFAYPWRGERKDLMEWRPPMKTAAQTGDPEALFRKLDEFERIAEKEKYAAPNWEKSFGQSNGFQGGPKVASAQLYRDNFSHYGTDMSNDQYDYPYTTFTQKKNYIAKPREQPKDFESMAADREFKRILDHQNRHYYGNGKPTLARASMLAKVVSSKGGQPHQEHDVRKPPRPVKYETCPLTTFPSPTTSTTTRGTTTTRSTTTTTRRPSTFCLPEPTTSPTRPPPTPPPSKSRKTMPLSECSAKIMLDTILASKQQALSVLKTLNYLEMEVMSSLSPDPCQMDGVQLKSVNRFKERSEKYDEMYVPPKPAWTRSQSKHPQAFTFGIRAVGNNESPSDLAQAREEELKLEDRVWEEHQQQMRGRRPWKPKRARVDEAPEPAARLEALPDPPKPQDEPDQERKVKPGASARNDRINVQTLSVIVKPLLPSRSKENAPLAPAWNSSKMPQDEVTAIRLDKPTQNDRQQMKHRKKKRRRKKKKHRFFEQQPGRNGGPIDGLFC